MIIEKEEIDKYRSKWGNRYNEISAEDLLGLMQGKVLYLYNGEYANFVYLENQGISEEYDELSILRKVLLGD